MQKWALQDAKQKLSALVDHAIQDGPQVITRHGREAAVVVSMEEWRRLEALRPPSLKDVLLAAVPAGEAVDDLDQLIGHRADIAFDRDLDLS